MVHSYPVFLGIALEATSVHYSLHSLWNSRHITCLFIRKVCSLLKSSLLLAMVLNKLLADQVCGALLVLASILALIHRTDALYRQSLNKSFVWFALRVGSLLNFRLHFLVQLVYIIWHCLFSNLLNVLAKPLLFLIQSRQQRISPRQSVAVDGFAHKLLQSWLFSIFQRS